VDPSTGKLALKFEEDKMKVGSEDIKTIQRSEVAPWLMALPRLFDCKVRAPVRRMEEKLYCGCVVATYNTQLYGAKLKYVWR
jgi:hypothetical protein